MSFGFAATSRIGLTWGHFSDGAVKCWLLYSEVFTVLFIKRANSPVTLGFYDYLMHPDQYNYLSHSVTYLTIIAEYS